jgi:hypothetical protein
MKTIYLAGPISGRPYDEYQAHFSRIRTELLRRASLNEVEIEVINPVTECEPVLGRDAPWHQYMRAAMSLLLASDGIALLQGWKHSKGTLLELEIAARVKIPIVCLEPPQDYENIIDVFGSNPLSDIRTYFNQSLKALELINTDFAWERAVVETCNRYLDPKGFEFIDKEPF